jgi:hypothetical protein
MMDVIGPLDKPSEYLSPDSYDVLISDIKPEQLPKEISRVMGIEYLSKVQRNSETWPVVGKVYGVNKRILITLPVESSKSTDSVMVHFIFDTGSPATFIAKSTLDALKLEEWQLGYTVMKVNGTRLDLSISDTTKGPDGRPCHFVGLNLLGMDFLERINASLLINMVDLSATIKKE